MKNLILLVSLLLATIVVEAQTPKISGSWLFEKVEQNGETQEPMFIIDFKNNGTMEARNMEIGKWKFNKKQNSITFSSEMNKKFNGDASVLELNNREMILGKAGSKLFYKRIILEEVAMMNEFSELAGNWQIRTNEGTLFTLNLEF